MEASDHARQSYDFFVVLDFEAQCDRDGPLQPQEIIEFPALLVDATTFCTVSEFHQYVRPTANRQLTDFCTQLTGITQDKVEGQPELAEVLRLFEAWLMEHGLLHDGQGPSWTFGTCGDWDLGTCLPAQAAWLGLQLPPYFRRWVNIKAAFNRWATSSKQHSRRSGKDAQQFGMPGMLAALGLQLVGRHHSGIDDSRNIAAMLRELARRGATF